MKKRLLMMMLLAMATVIFATTTVLQQHYQTAHAVPCLGHSGNEYCTGYHDGAVQANRDYKTANDLEIDQDRCTGADLYCDGYSRGYNDQADFLG